MKDHPARHGEVWLPDEETYVLRQVENNVPICKIADDVKRTQTGVYLRLNQIAVRKITEGMTIHDASKLTGLSVTNIRDYMEKKQEPQVKETLLSVAIEIRDLLKQLVEK